jgi:hypothetical protein
VVLAAAVATLIPNRIIRKAIVSGPSPDPKHVIRLASVTSELFGARHVDFCTEVYQTHMVKFNMKSFYVFQITNMLTVRTLRLCLTNLTQRKLLRAEILHRSDSLNCIIIILYYVLSSPRRLTRLYVGREDVMHCLSRNVACNILDSVVPVDTVRIRIKVA